MTSSSLTCHCHRIIRSIPNGCVTRGASYNYVIFSICVVHKDLFTHNYPIIINILITFFRPEAEVNICPYFPSYILAPLT